MLDYKGNVKERPKRVSIPMDDISSDLEIELAAIISEIETEKVSSNYYNKSLHYNIINNLAEKLELDGELSNIKISLGSCNVYRSQYLDKASISTQPIKASTIGLDTKDILYNNNNIDYTRIINNNSVLNEIIVRETTYKPIRNGVTADKLSKI